MLEDFPGESCPVSRVFSVASEEKNLNTHALIRCCTLFSTELTWDNKINLSNVQVAFSRLY